MSSIAVPVIPEHLRDIFRQMPDSTMHTPQQLAAVGLRAAGWPILPLQPDTKRLDKAGGGFKHGHRKRLPTLEDVVNVWQEEPTRNVAVAPDPSWIIVDVDPKHGASQDTLRALGLSTEGLHWRTRSGGWQYPKRLPRGFRASKGSTSNKRLPGIDLLGPNSLAVMPWSFVEGGIYRFEGDDWEIGDIPEDWEFLDLLIDTEAVAFGRITRSDREEGRKLFHRLRDKSEFRTHIIGLFGPNWQEALDKLNPNASGLSESHRDWAFTFAGTHFLRRNPRAPRILYAALEHTGWPQNPLRANPKSDPKAYMRSTVRRALAARHAKDIARLDDLTHRYGFPVTGLAAGAVPSVHPCLQAPPVPVAAKPSGGGGGRPPVVPVVAGWIGSFALKVRAYRDVEYERGRGWIRVPCWDLAEVLNVSPDTITRALKYGEGAGWWEREPITFRNDGVYRVDSLIRLRGAPC